MKTVRDRARRAGRFCAGQALAAFLWVSLSSHAQDPHPVQPSPAAASPSEAVDTVSPDAQDRWETQSVRELMQEDLRVALQPRTEGAAGTTAAHADQGIRPVLAPRLVALYGVGSALMAEVQVGRQAYLYVRGQAWPAGHVGDRGVYQLRGMNGACVQLERGEDRHSLCLRMLLGEVQP